MGKPTSTIHRVRPLALGFLLALMGGIGAPVQADTQNPGATDISTTPPDITVGVAPNVALTFDDSGSMASGFLPDSFNSCSDWGNYSKNKIYYNPSITYDPPLDKDGVAFKGVAWPSVPVDGFSAALGFGSSKVNLSNGYVPTYTWNADHDKTNTTINDEGCSVNSNGHAYYNKPNGTKVDLTGTNIGATVNGVTRTDAQERQNFANWYSYYRTRNLMAKTAISRAFAQVSTDVRVVWQTIWPNKHDSCNRWSCTTITRAWSVALGDNSVIDALSSTTTNGTVKSDFYTWLQKIESSDGTPDRAAAVRVGEFFKRDVSGAIAFTTKNPYWNGRVSGQGGGNLACRKNFHILVTDGYWNESDSDVSVDPGAFTSEADQTLPEAPNYLAGGKASIYSNVDNGKGGKPFSKSLANIAFYYWGNDLQPNIANKIKPRWTDLTATPPLAKGDSERLNTDIFYNYKNDPATWQHLSQYIVTLGIDGTLGQADLPNLISGSTPWPRAVSNQAQAIDDMWHAAINSRGGYFSASDPQKLVESLKAILQDVSEPSGSSAPASLNTAVLVPGALNYPTTYQPSDWTGTVTANDVDLAGNLGTERWNAAKLLDALDSPATARVILTGKYDSTTKKVSGVNFDWATLGAGVQQDWLNTVPYSDPATKDANGPDRLNWIRGDDSKEGGTLRTRNSLLGAIINSQTKYVAYPVDGYRNNFPQIAGGPVAPETTAMALDKSDCSKDSTCSSYEQFVKSHASRKPVVYVGANDGMLHAFDASQNSDGTSTASAGKELWAYVPYAVYPNLSKLSSPKFNTAYMPTVDATPVTRDVFFSEKDASGGAHSEWHTILVGGLRYGGRGVYALDITDPTATVSDASSKVLWEFTADSAGADSTDLTKANNPANLGYTFGQPNVGRLANGKWVVLIPSGYFPDCTKLSAPAPCDKPPAAANTTSSLFVVDAQTGVLIRELRTPSTVTSYGLTSPVLGDYTNDQIDDVAFAGDLVGNLWKFDLSDPDSSKWTISLAFKPAVNGDQPITVMPRLFPDPMTARFIVVFGTGKFLSADDNVSTNAITQSVYGIRDIGSTVQKVQAKGGLTKQTLVESTDPNLPRGLTNLQVPSSGVGSGGWYFDLDITSAKGERVVVTPAALFDTNRAVISTFIPGGDDPCDPGHDGALMVVNAATGGAGGGLSSPSSPAGWGPGGTYQVVGARVKNSPTGGALPIAAAVGGGQLLVPGLTLQNGKTLTIDDAIWRRRSWRELNNDQ